MVHLVLVFRARQVRRNRLAALLAPRRILVHKARLAQNLLVVLTSICLLHLAQHRLAIDTREAMLVVVPVRERVPVFLYHRLAFSTLDAIVGQITILTNRLIRRALEVAILH